MINIYETVKINHQSATPIYQQVIEGVERFCRNTPAGFALPPERAMAAGFGISRNSLRQAIAECCERGLLVQRWGKGIFTAEKEARKRILVIMSDNLEMSMPWNYILPGILERAKELSIEVEQISTTFLRSQTPEQIAAFLEQENFTGLLHLDYMSWSTAEDIVALRRFVRCPVLFPHVDESWSREEPFPMTRINERLAFRQTVETLVREGHRNIVSVMPFSNPNSKTSRGYTPAEYPRMLKEVGANPDPRLLLNVNHDHKLVRECVRTFLLHKPPPFTAFVCFSDFYAIMVVNVLKELRLKVPDDVSVMGFCGYPGGKFLDPPLATTDFRYHEIGRMAVDRLLTVPADWMALPEENRVVFSPYTVILRGSVRKLKGRGTFSARTPAGKKTVETASAPEASAT